jgi:hypothetical protein
MSEDKQELGWTVVELMGHRRLGAFVTEQEVAGQGFLRLEIPGDEGEPPATQFVSPASVYCLTPTTEAMARAVAARNRPAPVSRWELPQPKVASASSEWNCFGCGGLTSLRSCTNCEEQHPCSCMVAAENEVRDSRRDYAYADDGRTERDDF